MEIKLFEILDRVTFIPVMGIKMQDFNRKNRWILRKAGYGDDPICILLIILPQGRSYYDPDEWGYHGSRTMKIAHKHIKEKWNSLESGSVVDVEFILGETKEPKESEAKEDFRFLIQTAIEQSEQF